MIKPEILAPVGGIESLYSAVQAGADAVYLGGSKFSARAYASNFNDKNIKKAVKYSHLYGVKVYVTVNTLIKEREMKEAINYIKFLYEIGVDAVIIQDLGLACLIKKYIPEFEIHASTQMTIHNGAGALFFKNFGFKRIVLSRELSLKEIEYISKDLDIETEIFIHGALCVCYSGQCLMSSIIGGRSGNRGRCAQPCRLPYTLLNENTNKEKKGYILSPKDICTLEDINKIAKSGTKSLKIEGRMKRPEYVAGVVNIYRKVIDTCNEKEDSLKHLQKYLMQLFNREGFSKAYLFGNVGKDMMAYSFPKNTGVMVGKVEKDLTLTLKENISLKDGIRNKNKGFVISKIIKNNKEVSEAFVGDKIKLIPSNYVAGDTLYRTYNVRLMNDLSKFYKNPYKRKINLELKVKFKIGEPINISTFYKDKIFSVCGKVVEKALNKPLDKDRIVESLKKSGNTPFKFEEIYFECFEKGFLPVSSINSVRRKLIDKIEEYINNKDNKKILDFKLEEDNKYNSYEDFNKAIICVNKKEQLTAIKDSKMENIEIVVDIYDKNSDIKMENIRDKDFYIKVPNIIKEEFKNVCDTINKNFDHIKGIVTANMGIINEFKGKKPIIGDYKLNIFNSYSIDFLQSFMQSICLSVELNKREIEQVIKKANMSCHVLVYGKIELMVSEYCPIGSVFGHKNKNKSCNQECQKDNFCLVDRLGKKFILKTDKFCRSHIYNNVPINLIPNLKELKKINIQSYRLDFIDESYEETLDILQAFKKCKWNKDFSNYTRGHYKRGVE